jgi:hypothetical protein
MHLARAAMKPARDDALTAHDHRADSGIRVRPAKSSASFSHRFAHEFFIPPHHNTLGRSLPPINRKLERARGKLKVARWTP